MTVIELLSPANKDAGEGNRAYRTKIQDLIAAGVNVVEIELLTSSRAKLDVSAQSIPADRHASYYTCIHRAENPVKWLAYPMPPRQRLPTIPIPCRIGEPDLSLNLQELIDRVYTEGGHDDIDYAETPEARLSRLDAAWAAEQITTNRSER